MQLAAATDLPFLCVFRAGMKTPLSPTVSLDEGAYDLEDIDDGSEAKNEWDFTPDPSEARCELGSSCRVCVCCVP